MDADRLYDRSTSLRDVENALALGSGALLLLVGASRRSAATSPDCQPDSGLIIASDTNAGTDDFVVALANHRHYARETDPPPV